ncbi:MAG TPA: PEPxxWA-CTERM sorting domain-containing protein [Sphingobium sp.]
MTFKLRFPASVCGALLAVSTMASPGAAANLLTNGSFENPVLSTLSTNIAFYGNGSTAITGWTVDMRPGSTSNYVQLTNNSQFGGLNASDGIQFLDLTGITGRGAGVLSNAVATSSSLDYVVSFDVGAVFYTGSYGTATVDLLINGALAGSFTVQPPGSNGFNWQRFSYAFSGDNSPVRIGLYASFSQGSSDLGVGLDNVVLESRERQAPSVPEPASWAMMIGGFAIAGAAMRRRGAMTLRFA